MRHLALLAILVAISAASSSQGSTIPILLDVSDGEHSQHIVIDAPLDEFSPGSFGFDVTGNMASDTWSLDYQISGGDTLRIPELGADDQAGIGVSYVLTNLSSNGQSYSVTTSLPVRPRELAAYEGWFSPFVTDLNGDGAVLTGNPTTSDHYYMSLVDDSAFRGLLSAVASTEAGPYETAGVVWPFDLKFPEAGRLAGPPALEGIGMQFAMAITPGDKLRLNGAFIAYRVPEPSSIGTAIVTGLVVAGCCRFSRRYVLNRL